MSVTLYAHPVSPYCRSIHALLLLAKVEHTYKFVDLLKQEQLAEDYVKINPTSNVPALTHGDFSLYESHTLLRYIVNAFNKQEYYGKDLKEQALLDSLLDWFSGASSVLNAYVRDFVFGPLFRGAPVPDNREERVKDVEYFLEFIERVYLNKGQSQFLLNHNGVSIADLTAIANLTPLFSANFDFTKFPVIQKYLETLLAIPEVKAAHVEFFKLVTGKVPELNDFVKKQVQ